VAARHHNAMLHTGRADLVEDEARLLRAGVVLRQKDGRQVEAWRCAGDRQVVGADVHCIVTDLVGGEGDGVNLGDQQPIAARREVDDGCVLPYSGAEHKLRILRGK